MRTVVFFAPFVMLLACGGKEQSAGHGSGGSSTSHGGSNAESGGANAESGGANANGGSTAESGGTSATAGSAGNSASGGSMTGDKLVDCDLRKVVCKVVQPTCPENQVPSVNGLCFGPCVPIESCACSAAEECPFNDQYTCWQRTHCGPYVR